MNTNFLFPDELLPALRRRCHAALCGDDVELPEGLHRGNISIDNVFNHDVFDKSDAFVVYSEEKTVPLVGKFDADKFEITGELVRGGTVRQATSDCQVTVYAQGKKTCYILGDMLMQSFDLSARRRYDFRYFRMLSRNEAKAEEVDSWTVIYKFRVHLQPGKEEDE